MRSNNSRLRQCVQGSSGCLSSSSTQVLLPERCPVLKEGKQKSRSGLERGAAQDDTVREPVEFEARLASHWYPEPRTLCCP